MPVLYLIGCTAPPVNDIPAAVTRAQAAGWDVCVILTPRAAGWLADDLPALEELTGHPVRSEYKLFGQPDVLPDPDAILAAPLTLNTLSKWAMAMPDTLALGLLTEAIGKGLPLVALPYINAAQAAHPVVETHLSVLRDAGVQVLLGDGGHIPHPPGRGNAAAFPWDAALNRLPPTQ